MAAAAEVTGAMLVGKRVSVRSTMTGQVRFFGEVHYAKVSLQYKLKHSVSLYDLLTIAQGEWVGVELDEPLGKNSGTIKGVAYFECQNNHGVMVRPCEVSLLT